MIYKITRRVDRARKIRQRQDRLMGESPTVTNQERYKKFLVFLSRIRVSVDLTTSVTSFRWWLIMIIRQDNGWIYYYAFTHLRSLVQFSTVFRVANKKGLGNTGLESLSNALLWWRDSHSAANIRIPCTPCLGVWLRDMITPQLPEEANQSWMTSKQ